MGYWDIGLKDRTWSINCYYLTWSAVSYQYSMLSFFFSMFYILQLGTHLATKVNFSKPNEVFASIFIQMLVLNVQTIATQQLYTYKGHSRCTKLPRLRRVQREARSLRDLMYAALPYTLYKRLFPRLEPVTSKSQNSNITSCSKVCPQQLYTYIKI